MLAHGPFKGEPLERGRNEKTKCQSDCFDAVKTRIALRHGSKKGAKTPPFSIRSWNGSGFFGAFGRCFPGVGSSFGFGFCGSFFSGGFFFREAVSRYVYALGLKFGFFG